MNVRVIIGANAYACVETESGSYDFLLSPGRSPSQSLNQTAEELREKSVRLLKQAQLAEQAAKFLQGEHHATTPR